MEKPFDSKTPTICVIASPLQALCLASAILNLKIEDYQVVVIHSDRFEQVRNVLDSFKIKYNLRFVGWHRWRMRWYRMTSLIHRHNRYKRLFIGDYRSETLLYFGLQYISDGSDIVYLDDGNATIPLFEGTLKSLPLGKYYKYTVRMTSYRNVNFMKYFYSVYNNLDNKKYIVKHNNLSVLYKSKDNSFANSVYIIGVKTESFCKKWAISEDSFITIIDKICDEIKKKYPQSDVIYIPHGKDTSTKVKAHCETTFLQYKKLDIPVELYFVKQNQPKAIYGFGSSALYNLKIMMPAIDIYTVFIVHEESKQHRRLSTIADYYKRSGIIETIVKA